MDLYILDSLYRRTAIVSKFSTLIWTERYSAYGDFKIVTVSTRESRNIFSTGVNLGLSESDYVMTVKTVVDGIDDDGNHTLTISGFSLEAILDDRLARGALDDTTSDPQWVITGTPVEIAKQIFHDVCVTGVLDPGDVIPMVNEGSISPPGTVLPPVDVITYGIDPQSVYSAEVAICNQYLLGFRLVKGPDTSQLYFDVYTGSDRTTHQTALPAVVFSPEFGNLKNTSEVVDISTYKNVAYVLTTVGSLVVYPPGVDPSVEGFDRRVLIVNNTDITDPDPTVAAAQMLQLGLSQLALSRQLHGFDGEISQGSQYKYGRDYFLGDLVESRNSDGVTNTMQVIEQIFAQDNTGTRSYPTLVINEFVTPGSWIAEPAAEVWEDLGDTDYWEDRP